MRARCEPQAFMAPRLVPGIVILSRRMLRASRPARALAFAARARYVLGALPVFVMACQPKADQAVASPPPPTGRAARVVHATVLANGCQDLGQANGRLAEQAMDQLVEGCTSVPGGTVQFEATLLPSGRIEIAAGPGQPDVVPVCILKHSLMHSVRLSRPCRLDVKLAESSVAVALDAGSTP
jgi:hypothetical protein